MTSELQPLLDNLIPVALLLVIVLVVLGYATRRMRRTQRRIYRRLPPDPSGGVSCPRCGAAMDRGFVSAPRGIIWRSPQQRPVGMLVKPWDVLDNTLNMSFTPLHNLAWRCTRCRMLTIDHGGLVSSEGLRRG